MRALLDTHTFLWAMLDDPRLSPRARDAIEDGQNDIVVSAVTGFEIALKQQLGRLTLPSPAPEFLPARMTAFGFESLAVDMVHALRAATLPPIHRDPWDRILVAQAQTEGLAIVTADPAIARYDVPVLW